MERYFTPESLLSLLLLFQSIESSDLDLILDRAAYLIGIVSQADIIDFSQIFHELRWYEQQVFLEIMFLF
jgi:CBS-domain-containing membrane protein